MSLYVYVCVHNVYGLYYNNESIILINSVACTGSGDEVSIASSLPVWSGEFSFLYAIHTTQFHVIMSSDSCMYDW